METPNKQESTEVTAEARVPLRLSQLPKRIIDGGYSKRGEPALEEDAVALGLKPSDYNKIYICDRYAHLSMFHFKDDYATSETTPEAIYEEKLRVAAVRGWILDTQTKKVVCRSFTETTIHYTEPSPLTEMDWSGWTFKPFVEGTTIRVFWDGTEWLHSTHRKIDCRNSRIPGAEIEVLKIFKECLPNLKYEELDQTAVYVFQIVHQENQIMNPFPVEKPYVCHLATFAPYGFFDLHHAQPDVDGVLEYPNLLPGCVYLRDFILENAQDLLKAGWCFIAVKDFEIVQVAAPCMEYLMHIRNYNVAPYIPAELMYLRLPLQDRANLVHAVSHHLKEKSSPSYMEPWIKYNSERLAIFCAQNLNAKLAGEGISLTKTLTWLLRCFKPADVGSLTVEQLHSAYKEIIDEQCNTNGATMYRCFRDMDAVMEKVTRLFQKHLVAQANPLPVPPPPQPAAKPAQRSKQRKTGQVKHGGRGRGSKKAAPPKKK